MKKVYFFSALLGLLATFSANAQEEVVTIPAHDNVHMNWYGNYEETVTFPDNDDTYRKIIMYYRLSCPTGGCSDWDYTTSITLRHDTGETDFTVEQAPSITVNGETMETVYYSLDPTFTTEFDEESGTTIEVPNDPVTIVLYGDTENPTEATETFEAYLTNYSNDVFDEEGNVIDTVLVEGEETVTTAYTEYNNYFDVIHNIELGRLITPYANGLTDSWSQTFAYDVTDYAPLLKGEQTIRAFYDGWSDGFTVTLDFEFTKGTPPRDVKNVYHVYNGGFQYGRADNPIEDHLTPFDFTMAADETAASLNFTPSGHSFGGNENCAEFCSKYYKVLVNDTERYEQNMWRDDCGLNPHYPQPGTWLFDRANWCPGDRATRYSHELTSYVSAGENTVNVDLQPFVHDGSSPSPGTTPNPTYNIDATLITYGDPNFTNDVSVEEILSPNMEFEHSRYNPTCAGAEIRIKNTGGAPLTNVYLKYGLDGVGYNYYNWTGNLAFLESTVIELPQVSPYDYTSGDFEGTFTVEISSINGGAADENPNNNMLQSNVEMVPNYINEFVVWFKTNGAGNESSWTIEDIEGNVYFSRDDMANNETYQDVVTLEPGCYIYKVKDEGKNGLSFFANGAGTGYTRFRPVGSTSGAPIKSFRADFGTSITHYFTVGASVAVSELDESAIDLYPNPSSGIFQLDMALYKRSDVTVKVFSTLGKLVLQDNLKDIEEKIHPIDLNGQSAGVYWLQLTIDGEVKNMKIVKSE